MNAIALGIIAVQPAHPDSQPPASFAIEVSAPQKVSVGAPLKVQVKLTNTSKKSILVSQDMTKKAEFFYTIYVHDAGGNEPVKTDRHRGFRREELSTGFTFNNFPVELEPGKSVQDETNITALYEIDRAGKYTIQVERLDNDSKTTVKSNTIIITVVP
jgi:hypothetical protein